jgi:hypothetical protein
MMPNASAGEPPRGGGAETPWWEDLSAHSDKAEVRERIAELIRQGEVIVRPRPGDPDRVEVVPRDPSQRQDQA